MYDAADREYAAANAAMMATESRARQGGLATKTRRQNRRVSRPPWSPLPSRVQAGAGNAVGELFNGRRWCAQIADARSLKGWLREQTISPVRLQDDGSGRIPPCSATAAAAIG